MENRSLVTIAEHSKEKILYLLEMAKSLRRNLTVNYWTTRW